MDKDLIMESKDRIEKKHTSVQRLHSQKKSYNVTGAVLFQKVHFCTLMVPI